MIERILALFGYFRASDEVSPLDDDITFNAADGELSEHGFARRHQEARWRYDALLPKVKRLEGFLGLNHREFERVNNGADAVVRGERWEAFYREEGGLADMIANIRRAYFAKVGELKAGEHEALQMLAVADRLARELEREVLAVIETGKLERSRADQLARSAAAMRPR